MTENYQSKNKIQYQNKDLAQIKDALKKEFDKIDIYWTRDDKEIYKSAINLCNRCKTEISNIYQNPKYNEIINIKISNLKKTLQETEKNLKGYAFFSDNKEIINNVSQLIDNSENEILEIIEDFEKTINSEQSKKELKKIREQVSNWFFTENKDWSISLTSKANNYRIDEVLEWIDADTYLIDYSKCTNQKIKSKMEKLIWVWSTCYLKKWIDKTGNNTYVLINHNWEFLSDRALIWELVTLTQSNIIKMKWVKNLLKEKNQKEENLGNEYKIDTSTELDSLKGNITRTLVIKDIPKWLREKLEKSSDNNTFKDFLQKTEYRLDELIKIAKKNWRELSAEPVSKVWWNGSYKLEIHFITDNMEKDIKFLNQKNQNISDELRDIIDSNEWDYMNYVTVRINSKWKDYDLLTIKNNIFNTIQDLDSKTKNSKKIEKTERESILYWLQWLGKMIDNMIISEWNSWDNDDHKLISMKKNITDSIYSIQQTENLTQFHINIISDNISALLNNYKNTNPNSEESKQFKELIQWVLSWNKDKSQQSIRTLWSSNTVFWNTHTTFLKDDLDDDLDLNWDEFDEYYNNIKTKLDASNPSNNKLLDQLYNATDSNSNSPEPIKTILIKNWILPSKDILDDDKKINKLCSKIKDDISQTKINIQKNMPTQESLRSSMKIEMNTLMAKSNKTDEELSRLQILNVLEQDINLRSELLNWQIQSLTSDTIKFSAIEDIIRWNTTPLLARAAWWTNSEIYDDIVWAGWLFNRSDENSEILWSMIKMVAEEAVFMIISTVLIASWAWTALWTALIASRIWRYWMKAAKVKKIISIIKTSKKFQKMWDLVKKSKALGYIASKSWSIARWVQKWLIHTALQTTYRWEFDQDFEENICSLLQNSSMYSILWIIWQSAKTWTIAKWFTNSSTWVRNMAKVKIASFLVEELAMSPADLAITYAFSEEPMTKENVMNNIAMRALLESVPWIKDLILWVDHWKINWVDVSKEELIAIAKAQNLNIIKDKLS